MAFLIIISFIGDPTRVLTIKSLLGPKEAMQHCKEMAADINHDYGGIEMAICSRNKNG